jgi:hypothetical protein
MEYAAFKALKRKGETLYSPIHGTAWFYDRSGRPCLVADGLKDGYGIFAGTWQEAAEYFWKIYMVVPYLLEDGGDPEIALGTRGWRSSAATVIAGPWVSYDMDGMRQAAEFVLAFYQQGYRQVPGVLFWAAGVVAACDLSYIQIIESGLLSDDDDIRDEGIRAAIMVGDAILPALERMALHLNPKVRQDAMYVAGQLGDSAFEIIERGATDKDPGVRAEAINAVGKLGQRALPLLERAIEDADPAVRLGAVCAARRLGVPALDILARGLEDDDPYVRKKAVESAYALGPAGYGLLPRIPTATPNPTEVIARAYHDCSDPLCPVHHGGPAPYCPETENADS